jgi:hypothetical protein
MFNILSPATVREMPATEPRSTLNWPMMPEIVDDRV